MVQAQAVSSRRWKEARGEIINGIQFTRGDYVIAVEYCHRFDGDQQRRTFVKDAYSDEGRFDVVNSTELRAYNLKLKEVKLPTPLQVPSRERRMTRSTAQEVAVYRPDIHLVMDAKTEELIHKQN